MFNLMKDIAGPRVSVTTLVSLSFPSYTMKEMYRSCVIFSFLPSSSFCDPMDLRLQHLKPRSLSNHEDYTSYR